MEECLPLLPGDGVARQAVARPDAVVEVAHEKVVHIGDVKTVVTDVLVLLERDGVVHRPDGLGFREVLAAEHEKTHLFEEAVEAASRLVDLALEDAPHGKGHRPVVELPRPDEAPATEAVGVAAFEDGLQLVVSPAAGGGEAGDVLEEGLLRLAALLHGTGDLDADGAPVGGLEVGPIAVDKGGEVIPQDGLEGDLGVLLEETGSERAALHRYCPPLMAFRSTPAIRGDCMIYCKHDGLPYVVLCVHADGDRAVIDKGDFHVGSEDPGADGFPDGFGEGTAELFIKGDGCFMPGGADVGRAVALLGGCHQGELADDDDITAGFQDAAVHDSVFIVENAKAGDFLHEIADVLFCVIMADAEEDEKTLADSGVHGPVNRDGGTDDPLDDCTHLLEVLFDIILYKGKKYLGYDKSRW